MTGSYCDVFRSHCRPLAPITTGQRPSGVELTGLRAVLFDLYGTLFISTSGEVSSSREAACGEAMAEALAAVGLRPSGPIQWVVGYYFDVIESFHAESRARGVEYPEVRITEVWRAVLDEVSRRQPIEDGRSREVDLRRLAVEYEARANPVWPMPHLRECLRGIRGRRLLLGIISNAQFFSPLLFDALLDGSAESWGFDAELQFYSYRHGLAKPGLELFRMAAGELGRRGVKPEEVVYVGNDMLNDVLPAHRVGFRTALFAGDARSLRRRQGDQRLEGISPDVVLTDLAELNPRIIAPAH